MGTKLTAAMEKPTAHTVIKLMEVMVTQVRHTATRHILTEEVHIAHTVTRLMAAMATQVVHMATKHIRIKVVPAAHMVTRLTQAARGASFI
jgi:hypothetical protein